MLVVYISLTGQTRKFVKKLGLESLELQADQPILEVDQPYIIIAPSYDQQVTDILWEFVETGQNRQWLKGVAGGGNLNFNTLFGFTAKDLSRDFQVPLLHLFEFQGTSKDVEKLLNEVEHIGKTSISG